MGEGRDFHIDKAISNLLVGYLVEGSIYEELFPVLPVKKQSDLFYKIDKGDFFRIPETARAPKTEPNKIDFATSSAGYFADNYELQSDISWEDMDNADDAFNLTVSHAELVKGLLLLDAEDRVARAVTSGTNCGSYVTAPASLWSGRAAEGDSDPISDIETGKTFIQQNTGKKANVIVVGYPVHTQLIQHPQIKNSIKYVQRTTQANMTNALADLFGVEKYLVGSMIKNTGSEKLADAMSHVWSHHCIIAHTEKPKGPGIPTATAGITFRWKSPKLPAAFTARWMEDGKIYARSVRVGTYQDEKIVATDCIYAILNTF